MTNNKFPVLEYLALIIVIIFSFWLYQQIANPEINFCRGALSDLIKGKKSAAMHIDWENFRALDVDIAGTLAGLKENQREPYKAVFIKSFSFGFKQASGKISSFTGWRVYRKDEDKVIVACSHRGIGRTLLWTVSRSSRKLTDINWL